MKPLICYKFFQSMSFTGKRWPRVAVLAAFGILLFAAAGYWIGQIGCFGDDHMEALIASRSSVIDLVLLRKAPDPLHLLPWRVATMISPETPWVPMRWFGLAMHFANTWLVWIVLGLLVSPRAAIEGSVIWLFFRPGDETLYWAATCKDIQMLFWMLLSLWIWLRASTAVQRSWAAVPAMLSIFTKPTAVLLPLMLIILPEPGSPLLKKNRNLLVPIAIVTGTALLSFVLIWSHPGYWESRKSLQGMDMPGHYLGLLCQGLSGVFFLTYPDWQNLAESTGIALLICLSVLFFRIRTLARFGLIWFVSFLMLPVLAFGHLTGRYFYSAGFGAVIVLCVLLDWLRGRHEKLTILPPLIVALWVAGASVLMIRDYRNYRYLGEIGDQVVNALKVHREEIQKSEKLTVAADNMPLLPIANPYVWMQEYHLGFSRPVIPDYQTRCQPGLSNPCIEIPWNLNLAKACLDRDGDRCVRWFSPVK